MAGIVGGIVAIGLLALIGLALWIVFGLGGSRAELEDQAYQALVEKPGRNDRGFFC